VSGGSSLKASGRWDLIVDKLRKNSIELLTLSVSGEPSPNQIDDAVDQYRERGISAVLSIGGGSVIDAGKAISAMLPLRDSVTAYLEGIGDKKHSGMKIPFIAVPTTSGTGSEATKNAVLSSVGTAGYKKSLRHDNFVPDVALIDPELLVSCPEHVSAACGMDAFTQLLEAYVSPQASPYTDALAYSGIAHMKESLIPACTTPDDLHARASMAYAALTSGVVLANAGLGIVHGLASPIGGFFSIPHGVVCGTLVGVATKRNIERLRDAGGEIALQKYARIGALLVNREYREGDIDQNCRFLVERIDQWINELKIPRLAAYGITQSDLERIVEKTGNKNNPVDLGSDDIRNILLERL
jgi:alcohol dehydrogenase